MATFTLPQHTPEQRQEYLKKAAQARHERSVAKHELKSGKLSVAEALDDERLQRVYAFDFLRSIPTIGDAKAKTFMDRNGISANRRVKGLGRHQREKIVETFGNF